MKKNSKFLLLSMAAFLAMTSSAMVTTAYADAGLRQTKRAARKEKRLERRLEKVTNRANEGQAEGKGQGWLDRKGVREDDLQAKVRIAHEKKMALINQYGHKEFLDADDIAAQKQREAQAEAARLAAEKVELQKKKQSEEIYAELDDGRLVRVTDMEIVSFGDNNGNGQGTDPKGNGQGDDVTDPNNGGTDPNNGGTDPNNGGTDPNNGGTDPNNGGTDPNNGGTDPNNGGTPPKPVKKKKDGGDRQEQTDPKAKEKAKTEKPKTTKPATEKKNPTPPKSEKKKKDGGDRQEQKDPKTKTKDKTVKPTKDSSVNAKKKAEDDRLARIKREKALRDKTAKEKEAERQAQLDKKNEKKEEPKPTVCFPTVGEHNCVEPAKEEIAPVKSTGTVSGRTVGKDKDVETISEESEGSNRRKSSKSKLVIRAKYKNVSPEEEKMINDTIAGIFEKREAIQNKVSTHSAATKKDAALGGSAHEAQHANNSAAAK